MIKLPYCVYILFSLKDFKLYIGYTTRLEERFREHMEGSTKSTKGRRPFEVVFCEYYVHKADATRREDYFKTTAGKKALKLMLRHTLAERGYQGAVQNIEICGLPAEDHNR